MLVGLQKVLKNKRILNFSTNDYLNLSNHPYVKEKAIKATEKYGAGSGSSRLVSGTLQFMKSLIQEPITKNTRFM